MARTADTHPAMRSLIWQISVKHEDKSFSRLLGTANEYHEETILLEPKLYFFFCKNAFKSCTNSINLNTGSKSSEILFIYNNAIWKDRSGVQL